MNEENDITEIKEREIKSYTLACAYCGAEVTRTYKATVSVSVSCFSCKEKRRRLASKNPTHKRYSKIKLPKIKLPKLSNYMRLLKTAMSSRKFNDLAVRARKMELRTERKLEILRLRTEENATLEIIGGKLQPPITRERVRQIVSRMTEAEQLLFKQYKKPHRVKVATSCNTCGKIKKVYQDGFKGHGKHFCKTHKPKKTPEQLLAESRVRQHKYYQDASFREKHARQMREYHIRLKTLRPEVYRKHREREALYQKDWTTKNRARVNARNRERYHKQRVNLPKRYAVKEFKLN